MTSRDRINATVQRQPVERIPVVELGFWPETIARWRNEGLPADSDVQEYFGFDRITVLRNQRMFDFARRVVEENDTTRIVTDVHGRTVKEWKDRTATPITLGFPMSAPSDWKELREQLLPAFEFTDQLMEKYRTGASRGDFLAVTPIEPAWFFIEYLLGFEEGLVYLMAEPDESAIVLNEYADHTIACLEQLVTRDNMRFDAIWFFADLCYKNGMLFSPQTYTKLIQPIHRRFRDFCDRHDMRLMLHCDGDVREFIPLIIESGFDVIQPLEARAGNDVRKLKGLHGKDITFFGNISADVAASGDRKAIAKEVETKLTVAKAGGGYIYHIDHSVPPTISFADYSYMIDLVKEHGRLP